MLYAHTAQICWRNQNQIDLENPIVINMRARATGAGAPARGRGRSMNRPLQSDNCSIADATEIWIKLGENLELQNFEQVVKENSNNNY